MAIDNQDDSQNNSFQNVEFEDSSPIEKTQELESETKSDSNLTESDFSDLAQIASGIQPEKEKSNHISPEDLYPEPKSQVSSFLDPKKPFLKIIIGVALTSVTAIVMLVLGNAWSRIINPIQANVPPTPTEEPLDLKQEEINALKANLALIEQDSHEQPDPKPVITPTVEEPSPAPQPQSKSRPAPQPRPQPQPEPIDPYVRWAQLSSLGAVGSSDVDVNNRDVSNSNVNNQSSISTTNQSNSTTTPSQPTEVARVASLNLNNLPSSDTMPSLRAPNSATTENDNLYSSSSLSSLSPLAQRVITNGLGGSSLKNKQSKRETFPHQPIPIGTTIKAKLLTPLVFSDNSPLSNTRGTVTLTEPILLANGTVAIDKGSSLIIQVQSFESSGLVVLEAIAISYQDNQGLLQQREIPPETLLIRAKNNEPLRAKVKRSSSNSDLASSLLNNAVRAGTNNSSREARTLINSTVNSALGGRNRSRSSRDLIYRIEAGMDVSVYINSLLRIS